MKKKEKKFDDHQHKHDCDMKDNEKKYDDHKDAPCCDDKKNEKKCDDHKDVPRCDEKKNEKKCDDKKNVECCNCVEEMAKQLKKLKGQQVIVFEKDAIVVGTVKKVKDDAVLVLENAFKLVVIGDRLVFELFFQKLFISICEITEFAPLGLGRAQKALDNLKQVNAIKVL